MARGGAPLRSFPVARPSLSAPAPRGALHRPASMRIALALLLVAHGALHLLGVAKAFGLADVSELQTPISPREGLFWLTAGLLMFSSAIILLAAPRHWWIPALPGVLLSQWLIIGAWQDARWGTVANLVILLPLLLAAADARSGSLRARFTRDAAAVASGVGGVAAVFSGAATVRDEDVERADLPGAVKRYLRGAGVVGRPRVRWFEVRLHGRIRGGPGEAWMKARVRQVSRVRPAVRLYFMDAVRRGVPAHVLHRYAEGEASMEARVLGLVPVLDARGPVMLRSETVTMLNDFFLLAPAALLELDLAWEELDDHRVRVEWTNAGERVSAEATFDEAGRLVDFASDDRAQWQGADREALAARWSTPIRRYGDFGGRRQPAVAEARWADARGPWTYAEFTIDEVRVNGAVSPQASPPDLSGVRASARP